MTTMTADEAVRMAIRRVAPEADLAGAEPGESLREAFDLDSLDFLEVLEKVEQLTHVPVPESAYAQVDSLDALVRYVAERMS